MQELADIELLRNYAEEHSEEAFAELVARQVNLVYSVALRQIGNPHLAEEITQAVFVLLANKAAQLRHDKALSSWLFQATRLTANNFARSESRRQHREQEAFMQSALNEPEEELWPKIAPLLDAAVADLGEKDRRAIMLRFYEGLTLREVGQALETTEAAGEKRVNRAVEKLQKFFLRRGIASTTASIAGVISAHSVEAAPATLAKTVTAAVLAKGAAGGASWLLATAKGVTTMKAAGATGLLGMLLAPLISLLPNYLAYRVTIAGAQTETEQVQFKAFFRKVGVIVLGLFIPFALVTLWLSRHQTDRFFLSSLAATVLAILFLATIFTLGFASMRRSRAYYSMVLKREHGGIFPKPTWEYRSRLNFLGLPLVQIRIGDRFDVLKQPVRAWIAAGNIACGGLFACGIIAIAPISLGSMALGGLAIGGLGVGIFALGGFALGIWTLFGGLLIGWQAFGGSVAIAWSAATGDFALAHDFAQGRFAWAAQANNDVARQFIEANLFSRCAHFLSGHWLWLNLFWIVPLFVQWWVTARKQRIMKHGNQKEAL